VQGSLAALSPFRPAAPAPYLFSFSPAQLPPLTRITLRFTVTYAVGGEVVATRSFWTPPRPSSPLAPCTVSPNPVASFPQRYTLLCTDWSSSSAYRFLPLSYAVGLPTFPILDTYSPLMNLYIPRPFVTTEVTLVYSVSDWRNLTTGASLVLSIPPESGTYLDLLQFIAAAAEARDVGILPPLAYQALTSVAYNVSRNTVSMADGKLATETIVIGMYDTMKYFPITAITVAQSAEILRLAFEILPDPALRSDVSAYALSIVSCLCKALPVDTSTLARYQLVNVRAADPLC
jgi:hypothetical protein